jgi:hypothetical protein
LLLLFPSIIGATVDVAAACPPANVQLAAGGEQLAKIVAQPTGPMVKLGQKLVGEKLLLLLMLLSMVHDGGGNGAKMGGIIVAAANVVVVVVDLKNGI